MDGYLLSCLDDFYWVRGKHGQKISVIGHNDHLAFMAKENIPSFYSIEKNTAEIDMAVEYLTFNWHRNESGEDEYIFNGLSIAESFSTGAWISNSSICREYFCLQSWLKRFEIIYISYNESEDFKKIASLFGQQIKIYDPAHRVKPLLPSINARHHLINKTPLYLNILRFIQRPILNLLNHKTIAVKDWVILRYEKNQSSWLSINTLRFWKSAYLRDPTLDELLTASSKVPKNFDKSLSLEALTCILDRVNVTWDAELVLSISERMKKSYEYHRNYFIWVTAAYENLLNSYKPLELVITSELYEPYSIAAQIAKSKGVRAAWMVDGYPVIPYSRLLGDKRVGPIIFDVIYAMGLKHKMLLEKNKGIGQKLEKITPPIFELNKRSIKCQKKYDVIIMTLTPNDLSINGYLGSSINNLIQTIEVARQFGFKKIAIKIKHQSEKAFLKDLKSTGFIENIVVLEGNFSRHINSARCIIGGISSAIGEAIFNEVPYYIYEPINNGFNEERISNSLVFEKKFIARDKEELLRLLNLSMHLSVDKNYVL